MTIFWGGFPKDRLLAEVSLWSADFTCFREDIIRIDPYADLYHIDVSDAHFVPGLLFFPDLVAALRPLTVKKFHVHLMAENPLALVDEFAAAGADIISVHAENGPLAFPSIQRIRDLKLAAGLAVGLTVRPEEIIPYLDMIDVVILMGTAMGVKGVDPSPLSNRRIQQVRAILKETGYSGKVKIEADGGIRTHTVPGLRAAGADLIVAGSLAFKTQDLDQTFDWVHRLPVDQTG